LERAPPGEHAVAELDRLLAAAGDEHLRRHREHLPTKPPRLPQGRRSFVRLLDDVDDVAEVDDIRLLSGHVRPVNRVPPAGRNSPPGKHLTFSPPPAAVVEEGPFPGARATARGALARR